MADQSPKRHYRVGLALGSGAARGWSHIGVIAALEQLGIAPDVVAGTSIGALVGAAYACNRLNELTTWVRGLSRLEVLRTMDISLGGAGLIEGQKLMGAFGKRVQDVEIESLERPFCAVATDLNSGREIWLNEGSVLDAVRASIALPGLFTPVYLQDRWLVDGGLVNPVPISVCRAMGADLVIAVNLNNDLVGPVTSYLSHKAASARQQQEHDARLMRAAASASEATTNEPSSGASPEEKETEESTWNLLVAFRHWNLRDLISGQTLDDEDRNKPERPGLFDVTSAAIGIMQDRITRSRMAGDPPDIVIAPRLPQLALMDFHRAGEAIEEGYEAVHRALPLLEHLWGKSMHLPAFRAVRQPPQS